MLLALLCVCNMAISVVVGLLTNDFLLTLDVYFVLCILVFMVNFKYKLAVK